MFWTIYFAVLLAIVTGQAVNYLIVAAWWYDWKLKKSPDEDEPTPMATYRETDNA